MNGYIKLFRQLKEWEWYANSNVKALFLHCLLSANFKSKKWEGKVIERGQFVTSLSHLADDLGLSVQNIRTCIQKLEKTGELTKVATSTYTVITVCKFDSYQCFEDDDKQGANKVLTINQQTTNNQSTINQQQLKKDKKDKNDNKEKNKDKSLVPLFIEIAEYYKSTTGQNILIGKTDSLIIRSDKFKKISERLKNGATVEDCKAVIKLKNEEWKNDKKMSKNINIPTLFRASNFEKYLDAVNNSSSPIITKENNFPYPIPTFDNKQERQDYFLARYSRYKESGMLDEYKANTEYRQRAIYEQDAERLCFELELEIPNLLNIEFNYKKI